MKILWILYANGILYYICTYIILSEKKTIKYINTDVISDNLHIVEMLKLMKFNMLIWNENKYTDF